jgi:hypothetical protein
MSWADSGARLISEAHFRTSSRNFTMQQEIVVQLASREDSHAALSSNALQPDKVPFPLTSQRRNTGINSPFLVWQRLIVTSLYTLAEHFVQKPLFIFN